MADSDALTIAALPIFFGPRLGCAAEPLVPGGGPPAPTNEYTDYFGAEYTDYSDSVYIDWT